MSTMSGHVTAAEVSVSHHCAKCFAWQGQFNGKTNFHRCEKCSILQRGSSYEPTVTAKVSLAGDFGEVDLINLINSVLKHHLEEEGLMNLLCDRQNVEEYLFEMGMCVMQKNTVIGMRKVEENSAAAAAEAPNLFGEAASPDMEK